MARLDKSRLPHKKELVRIKKLFRDAEKAYSEYVEKENGFLSGLNIDDGEEYTVTIGICTHRINRSSDFIYSQLEKLIDAVVRKNGRR